VQKNISRQFFEYDPFANLTLEIKDNGSGLDQDDLAEVTVRTIRRIEPITTPLSPAFGKPHKIEETYWENGQERPLSTTYNSYDNHGYLSQQDRYDAQNQYRYSLYFTHDPAGRLLSETDALGRQTFYS